MEHRIDYRIILTKNRKHKKVLRKGKNKDLIFQVFNELIENNIVLFPKKFNNYKEIKQSNYEILILKEREETDKNRMVRNEIGQLVEEKTTNSKWIILESSPYEIEETFWVWGHNAMTDRFDSKRIIREILLSSIRKKNMIKEVVIVHNKLIISSDLDDFNLIICKCHEDAIRLHNALKEAVANTKIKKILFFGIAKPKQISDMYELIMQHTGWDRMQVRRLSTRH